jgi:hypothetical protein
MAYQPCWTELGNCTSSIKENQLQRIFNDWAGARDGWQLAGVPAWLLKCRGPNRTTTFRTRNYSDYPFTPDALFENDEVLVLELKRSPKYEELALAEVLHHAWKLRDPWVSGRSLEWHPKPVMVTSCSAWMRAALSYLFKHGLEPDALRYVELCYLNAPDGSRYLWFVEPFAAWSPVDHPPPCVPSSWASSNAVWYQVQGCDTWIGTEARRPERLPFVPDTCAVVAKVTGSPFDFLVWTRTLEVPLGLYYRARPSSNETFGDDGAPACPYVSRL